MKAVPLIGIARHRLTIDGEGVTTLVAFHGCPLRCKYCLNPTSLQPDGVWESYNCNQLYEEVRKDERPISTQQTAFTFVAQMRANLPDAIGGVLWFPLYDAGG